MSVSRQAVAPIDDSSAVAYERYFDAQNQDRELYEQEKLSAERYLRQHNSAWLYFPHIELVFLLFAYQGASAAEARLIYSGCFPLVVMGICTMVRVGVVRPFVGTVLTDLRTSAVLHCGLSGCLLATLRKKS